MVERKGVSVKLSSLLISILLSTACTEYQVVDPKIEAGAPNPAEITVNGHIDHIKQETTPKTDTLFVIDNSCSMIEEQTDLINSFDSFIGHFVNSPLDWHVGVISTDTTRPTHQGRLQIAAGQHFIDSDTLFPEEVFSTMAAMGTTGSGTEKGLDTTYEALEVRRDTDNIGFYRPDAHLSIVVISDEDDYSFITNQEFSAWLLNLKFDPEKVTFSSIVCLTESHPYGPYCADYNLGEAYMAVTATVGGVLYDIRDQDWDQILSEIGILSRGPSQEFYLSDIPVESSIEVWVEIEDEAGLTTYNFNADDYWYNNVKNSISFNTYVPPEGSDVYISYKLLAWYLLGDTGLTINDF